MAPETSPSGGATRYIQTTRGFLSYSQLAPLLAEQVSNTQSPTEFLLRNPSVLTSSSHSIVK